MEAWDHRTSCSRVHEAALGIEDMSRAFSLPPSRPPGGAKRCRRALLAPQYITDGLQGARQNTGEESSVRVLLP